MWAAIWVTTTLDLTNRPIRTDTLRCHHRYGMSHLVKYFTVNFCIANRLFHIMPPHHRYNKRMLGWCNAHHRVDGLPTLVLQPQTVSGAWSKYVEISLATSSDRRLPFSLCWQLLWVAILPVIS